MRYYHYCKTCLIVKLQGNHNLNLFIQKGSAPAADPGRVFDILWCGDLSALVVLWLM